MFEAPIVARFAPQMMDKFKENKTTREMVREGVKSGYKISSNTPSFLYGYEEIIDLLLRTEQAYQYINNSTIAYMLKVETRRRELVDYILDNYSNINLNFSACIDLFENIEVNKRNSEFINSKLRLSYIEKNVDYIYSKYFNTIDYSSYLNEIAKLIIDNNLELTNIKNMDEKLFAELLKYKPELLQDINFFKYINESLVKRVVGNLIIEGKMRLEDIPKDYIYDTNILKALVSKDFMVLDEVTHVDVNYRRNINRVIMNEFVERLPESLVDLPIVCSFISDSYDVSQEAQNKIIESIKETNYSLSYCGWDFILKDKDIVMNNVRSNPNVLNTCSKLFNYVDLSDAELEEIANIVINNNLVVHILHEKIMRNERLASYILHTNPEVLNYAKEVYYQPPKEIVDELIEARSFDINAGTFNLYGVLPYTLWKDAIRRNPYNLYSFNFSRLSDEQLLEIYHVFLEHNVPMHSNMLYTSFANNPQIVLEGLKQKKLTFNPNFYVSSNHYEKFDDKKKTLNTYLIANYGSQLNRVGMEEYQIPLTTFEEKIEYLAKDPLYAWHFDDELTDEQQRIVSEVYFKNRDAFQNCLHYKLLKNNPYVVIGEIIHYDNYLYRDYESDNPLRDKKYKDYFTDELKKNNKKVDIENICYVTDIDLVIDFVKENPQGIFHRIDKNVFSEEEQRRLEELFLELIKSKKIDVRDISEKFLLKHFDEINGYFDGNAIIDKFSYSFDLNDEIKACIRKVYKEGRCDLSLTLFAALEPEELIALLRERPISFVDYPFADDETLSEEVKQEAAKIFSDSNLPKVTYVEGHNYTSEEVIELVNNSYYNVKNLSNLYFKNLISLETYNYYYNKLLTDVMNGNTICSSDISEVNPYYDISYTFLEYCAEHNLNMFCSLIKTFNYSLVPNKRIFDIIYNKLDKSAEDVREKILNSVSLDVRNFLLTQRKDLITASLLRGIIVNRFKKYTFTEEEVYDIWVSLGKPVDDFIARNKYILKDLLEFNKEAVLEIGSSYFYDTEEKMLMVYNAFKDDENLDVSKSPVLFENVYIVNKLLNTSWKFEDEYSDEYLKSLFLLCRDNKNFYDFCYQKYRDKFKLYIYEMIEKNPESLVEILNYSTIYSDDIAKKLVQVGYVIGKDTPKCYCTDQLIHASLQKNPESVMDIKDKLDPSMRVGWYSGSLLVKLLKEKGIYGINNCDLFNVDIDYLKESIRINPNLINEIDIRSLRKSVLIDFYQVVLEVVRDGKYNINENTPKVLFYNDELYDMAKKINPSLLNGFTLNGVEKISNDNKLIEEAILKPLEVNQLLKGRESICEETLLNKLVTELININYVPSSDTPPFLFYSYKFMEYCIINNYVVDNYNIEKFTTFENLYKTQNAELFRKLVNNGYGREFKKIIFALGLDVAIDLGMEYGYLLNRINYGDVRIKNDVYKEIMKKYSSDRNPDILTRCIDPKGKFSYIDYITLLSEVVPIFFSDTEKYAKHIEELIRAGYVFNVQTESFVYENEELIEMVITLSDNPEIVSSFVDRINEEKLTDKLILLALKKGYNLSERSHLRIKNNPEYLKIGFSFIKDRSKIKTIVDSLNDTVITEEIIDIILKKGYLVDAKTPEVIKNTPKYIRLFLERATEGKELDDIVNNMVVNEENVIYAIKKGYSINSSSAQYLKDNLEYISLNIDSIKTDDSLKMRNLINTIGLEKLNSVINEKNIDKIAAIFGRYYAEKSDFLPLYEKFVSVPYNKKRELIFKVLSDGKRISVILDQYEKYVFENFAKLEIEDLDKVINCLYRIENSNSGEIRHFATSIISELLAFDNYEEKFVNIEKIFLQSGLPMVSKLFSVFKILHGDYKSFDNYNGMSPVLKNSDRYTRDKIIYRDLIISAVSSNNRSLKEYLCTMSEACNIVKAYEMGNIKKEDSRLLKALNFLVAIINSDYIRNHTNKELIVGDNLDLVVEDIKRYFNYQNGDLRDSIVQTLFDFKSFDLIVKYMNEIVGKIDAYNREKAEGTFELEVGDFVKGIGSVNYLSNILQNGSVSKEFLGDCADSDLTPLDTDCSLIEQNYSDMKLGIASTEAKDYGSIWIVVKKSSNNFVISRDKDGETANVSYNPGKLEAFYTGAIGTKHYGIRTGFPSSMIDYFIVSDYDSRLGLEIALNGFYIPVVSTSGEVLFTPKMYDDLRNRMSGLSYFETGPYQLASYEDLTIDGLDELMRDLDNNRSLIKGKHEKIKNAITQGVAESGFKLKDKLDGNLIPGYVELIDTGSTARGTDLPGKADFDYICRVDRDLFVDKEKFQAFRERIIGQFPSIEKKEFAGDNFRFKGVTVPGLEGTVDIDVSFVIRTTKLSLSSDESLLVRLNAIANGEYVLEDENDLLVDKPKVALDMVTANILMAKKLLKKFEAYKKHNSPEAQGGLGGIGIENWILQHGGSLKKAAEDFLRVANTCSNYEEFKRTYQVWDFGENHYSFEKASYPHDDFVYNNMDGKGYEKMKKALTLFLEYGTKVFNDEELKELEKAYEASIVTGNQKHVSV